MSKTLTLKVTAKNITKGRRRDTHWCPIALALRDLGLDPEVDQLLLIIECPETGKRYQRKTPKTLIRFINDFDTGHKVKPFERRVCFEEIAPAL